MLILLYILFSKQNMMPCLKKINFHHDEYLPLKNSTYFKISSVANLPLSTMLISSCLSSLICIVCSWEIGLQIRETIDCDKEQAEYQESDLLYLYSSGRCPRFINPVLLVTLLPAATLGIIKQVSVHHLKTEVEASFQQLCWGSHFT